MNKIHPDEYIKEKLASSLEYLHVNIMQDYL